jgi:hypothetical protein
MPEAVDSNTTAAPTFQPPFEFSDEFDDIRSILEAFNMMNAALMDEPGTQALSYGTSLLFGLVINHVDEVHGRVSRASKEYARSLQGEEGRELLSPVDSDLMSRIVTMCVEAYREAGRAISDDASE